MHGNDDRTSAVFPLPDQVEDKLHGDGGEGGIRTHGTAFLRHNRLAGDPDQPLQHLSVPSVVPSILALFQKDSSEKKKEDRVRGFKACLCVARRQDSRVRVKE